MENTNALDQSATFNAANHCLIFPGPSISATVSLEQEEAGAMAQELNLDPAPSGRNASEVPEIQNNISSLLEKLVETKIELKYD